MSSPQTITAKVLWNDSWDPKTAELAYEATKGRREAQTAWMDALDTKLVSTVGAASVLLTLVPSLQPPGKNTCSLVLWCLALASWVIGACFAYYGYKPAEVSTGPHPRAVLDESWLRCSPLEFRLYQIANIADTYEQNITQIDRKAWALSWVMRLGFLEVLALSGALMAK